MDKTKLKPNYVAWFNAEEMHKHTQDWLSELEFIQDEHLFFEDLVKSFTPQLIENNKFEESKEMVDVVNRSEKRNQELIEAIKDHGNKLEIMVDGKDQPKEEAIYKEEHRNLILKVSDFLKDYQSLKGQLFEIIHDIMKKEKQIKLLDNK